MGILGQPNEHKVGLGFGCDLRNGSLHSDVSGGAIPRQSARHCERVREWRPIRQTIARVTVKEHKYFWRGVAFKDVMAFVEEREDDLRRGRRRTLKLQSNGRRYERA